MTKMHGVNSVKWKYVLPWATVPLIISFKLIEKSFLFKLIFP
jgi:hypothetical protein